MNKKRIIILSVCCTFIILTTCLLVFFYNRYQASIPWYEKTQTICHALGVTETGETLTNSIDALRYNYDRGHRIFEVDMQITSDNVMVLRHDWYSDLGQAKYFGWTDDYKEVPTLEQFLNAPIYDKYTPSTLLDLYEFMHEHKDVYMILDPKYSDDVHGQFSLIANTAIDNGYEKVLDRVVVQLYYEDMYEMVKEVYPFKNYLYTLYAIGYTNTRQEEQFCQENGIPVLVMPYTWMHSNFANAIHEYGLKVFVHTVNEPADAQNVMNMGVDGIYTDSILPPQLQDIIKQNTSN